MPKPLFCLIILTPLALAACATLPPPDRKTAQLADAVRSEADAFYAGLAAKPSPDCGYAANADGYDRLAAQSVGLTSHLEASRASAVLRRAGKALAAAIEQARASHVAASANSADTFGLCLAPVARALNADAISRASQAIAASQLPAEDQ